MNNERGKIIPFDRNERLQRQREASVAMAHRQQQDREALFETQELACVDDKIMNHEADRLLVAKSLFQLLKRFEQETGHRKVDVIREANIGGEGDSTKRLEYLTIDPDTPPSPRRVAKLTRRLRNYKKLARKAAELARWQWPDVLADLCRGTSFFPDSEDPNLYPTHTKTLHTLLNTMGEWLRNKTAIDAYFERLRVLPIFDEWGNFIVSDDPAWAATRGASVADGDPWLLLSLSLPSALLYRELIDACPVDFASNEGLPEELRYVAEPPQLAVVEQLQLRTYREVRLGMAPPSWSKPAEMVFEERLIRELWGQDGWRGWLPYYGDEPGAEWAEMAYYSQHPPTAAIYADALAAERSVGSEVFCWIRSAERKSRGIRRPRKIDQIDYPPEQRPMYHFSQVNQRVRRAELKNCVRYLGVSLDATIELFLTRSMPGTVYESPPNTVAAALEVDLYAGIIESDGCAESEDDEDQFPVDLRLKQEIDRRCSLLERCLVERDSLMEQQRQRVLARWDLDGDAL